MKSNGFEQFFNKNANKKHGNNESIKKGAKVSNNRAQQRSYTITQNKGKGK